MAETFLFVALCLLSAAVGAAAVIIILIVAVVRYATSQPMPPAGDPATGNASSLESSPLPASGPTASPDARSAIGAAELAAGEVDPEATLPPSRCAFCEGVRRMLGIGSRTSLAKK